MNNYAVSSDGIATALQDSASALMEAGNSLEQATALVAAANKVVQDPNSVGAALRTISLRLRGTSVEILEEMGEETDGVVESTSKLQEKLKALTGVDILTATGDYKDTYTILREIGEVWQDLDSLDQAAALELMAGKNRANTLSAILNNIEDLEGAYTDAMNAEGSAMRENETFLNSIEGRIKRFTTAVQTMWANFLDSGVVKFIVDVGTGIIQLIDKIGLLESAVGAFFGFNIGKSSIKDAFSAINAGTFKFKDMFKFDVGGKKEKSDPTVGAFKVVEEAAYTTADALQAVADAAYTAADADKTKETSAIAAAEADATESVASNKSAVADVVEENNSLKASNADAVEAQNSLKASNADIVEANNSLKAATADASEGVASVTSTVASTVGNAAGAAVGGKVAGTVAKSALATGATKVGAALLGGLKGLLISAVISIGLDLLGKLFGAIGDKFESEEEKIEKATDALNEYSAKQKELKDQKQTVDELSESYTRLSTGVDTLTNTNIGLTTEAYQEYLEVCNDIADMFPELVDGYDAQGNAIIDLKGDVEELTAAYIRAQEEAARTILTDENLSNVWTKYESNDMNSAGKYWLEDDNGNHSIERNVSLQDQRDILRIISSMGYDDLMRFYGTDKEGGFLDGDIMWDILQKQIEAMGIPLTIEEAMGIFNSLNIPANKLTYDEYVAYINNEIASLNRTITENMSGIREVVSASLLFDEHYNKLGQDARAMVQTIINNMDPNLVADSGAENADDFIDWFSTNVIAKVADNEDMYADLTDVSNKMVKAMLNGDMDAFKAAQAEFMALVQSWADESGNIVVDPDANPVIQYLQQLALDIQNKAKNFEVRMEIRADADVKNARPISEVVNEYTGDIQDEIQRAIKDLKLGEDATLGDIFGTIGVRLDMNDDGKLRVDEIHEVYDAYLSYIAGNTTAMDQYTAGQREAAMALHYLAQLYGTDVDTIIAEMVELGYAFKSLDDVVSFNLESESTNEFVDKFQEDVDTIKDAWESLNSGEMTQSDFLDLAQEFPELMEGVNFSDDNWMTKARENLEALNATTVDDFIADLNEMKDAMIARGEDTSIIDSMIAYAEQYRNMSQIVAEVQADTVAGLTEAHERYKSIMEETNEILFNGQRVSEGYYESLAEYIDDTEALNACFDENNRQIVTNVDALKELIEKQREADTQTVRLAKSQAQLRYYELVRQLGDTMRTFVGLSAASDATVDSLLDQIGVVKDAIAQYQLFEDNLLGTTSAFEKFTAAKELDDQNTYGASYAEMAQTMYDALYTTGQVGSAQFWAAVEATVPDNIYKHLIPGTEQIRAIYDYFNKNIMPTLTFDESSFSIDYSDIEAFIKKAQETGVFSGTDVTSFGLSSDFIYGLVEGENALEAFAKRMGMTVTQVYAMLSEMDKYTTDGAGLSMLMQLDTSTSGQITYITSELEKLYAQRRTLMQQGASDTALSTNMAQIYEYESQLAGLQKQATDAVQDYIAVQNALVDTSKTVREALPYEIWRTELQLTGDETVQEVLQQINDYVLTLQEPTVMELQIARDSIDDEIDGLIQRFTEEELEANVTVNEDGLREIKDGNLTIDAATLERYVELKNAQLFIDDTLMNSMSVQEQLLTNIDKNVATIAGEEPVSSGGVGENKDVANNSSTDKAPNATPNEKPAPNQALAMLTLDTSAEISKLLDAILNKQIDLAFSGNMTMADETAYDELEDIWAEAKALQEGILDGTIYPENALAKLSELQTQASWYGVEIPVTMSLDQQELETSATEATDGLTIKPDVDLNDNSLNNYAEVADNVTDATANVGDAANEAASEVDALYGVYASPAEALATLEAIEDKTHVLTPEEALAFGWSLAEGEILTVADAINRVKQEQDALRRTSIYNPEQFQESVTIVKTLSELQEEMSEYNEVLTQTEEIISDNIEVSQEYKDSLLELGITEEELNECFDDGNPLLVTNAQLLNKLVKGAKNNVATNIKLAKSQAQLEYYELYKEIAKLTDGTQEIDGATLDYIQSLYGQMGAIQQNIAQFSMLEAQLLGATSAYEQLEAAQAADSANDYGSRAEELVNILGHAFNTGELGTQAAQTAIAGLIPDGVIDKALALDEQMQQIYEYFTKGKVSQLFTIEFDDDGNISSVEMTRENVEAFTQELIEAGEVFHGTWDEFTLDPSIKTLDDFAAALGVTKEVAFAYLTELEKYDINWLGGDYETLLDQLMGDNFEYQIQKTIQKMAQLRQEMVSLMEGGVTADEAKRIAEIEAELTGLETKMDESRETAYDTWHEYAEISSVLSDTANMGKKVSDVFSSDLIAAVGLTGEETVEEAYNRLLAYQTQLGQPTELVLQFAKEQAIAELDALKTDLESNTGVDIEANVHFNTETGEFEYAGDTTGWTEEDIANLQAYLDLSGDLYEINQSLGLGIEAMEGYAQRTADAVESIDQKIAGDNKIEQKPSGTQPFANTIDMSGFSEVIMLESTGSNDTDSDETGSGGASSDNDSPASINTETATVNADNVVMTQDDSHADDSNGQSPVDGDITLPSEIITPEADVAADNVIVESTNDTIGPGLESTGDVATDAASEFTGAQAIVTTITESPDGVTVNLPSIASLPAYVGEYKEIDGGADKDGIKLLTTAKVGGYQLAKYVLGRESINPPVTGNVTGYTLPEEDDVGTDNINPDVTGIVDTYEESPNGANKDGIKPVTTAMVGGYQLAQYVLGKEDIKPATTAEVSSYKEIDEGADKDALKPVTAAEVGSYALAEYVTGRDSINPPVTGQVIGYAMYGEDVVTSNVNPPVTGSVTGYQLADPAPSTTNVNPHVTGVVTEYDEVGTEGGASTSDLNPVTGARVDSYTEVDDGADKSQLNPSGIPAHVSDYIEAPSVDKSKLAQDITARIIAYDDTGATMPEVIVKVAADDADDNQTPKSTPEKRTTPHQFITPITPVDDTRTEQGGFADTIDMTIIDPADVIMIDAIVHDDGLTEDVTVDVELDTESAEEAITDLGNQVSEALAPDEILEKEGLSWLSLERALYEYDGIVPHDFPGPAVGFDTTIFTQVLQEAEYTEEQINALITRIQEYANVIDIPSNPDPLGLNDVNLSVEILKDNLATLGVGGKDVIGQWFDGKRDLKINVQDLRTALQEKGWTQTAIEAYLQQLGSMDFEGTYRICLEYTDYTVNDLISNFDQISSQVGSLDDAAITDKEFDVVANGASETMQGMRDINRYAIDDKEYTITTTYARKYTTIGDTGTARSSDGGGGRYTMANGTAHAQGTAHKGGSWGAEATETALVGELGPELRVRGNKWELLGEQGAEFRSVRRGDIIFNHKQTEELLTNGYITGRGKAFAEGTVGGSAYAHIREADVLGGGRTSNSNSKNDQTVKADTVQITTNTAGVNTNTSTDYAGSLKEDYGNQGDDTSGGGGGGGGSDDKDEFNEVFDWIEVRLEEIHEDINLNAAKLENAIGSTKKNAIIDNMIGLNKDLHDTLIASANEYYRYAEKLLADVPAEYRAAAKDGKIAIEEFVGEVDEETLNAIQKYREWVQKGADVTQQAEEVLTEISNLAKQAIDNIAQDYENKSSFSDSKIGQFESYNALIETDIGYESEGIYRAMIEENNRRIGVLQEQRNAMLAELNKRVESGEIKRGSQAWYDAINEVAAVDTEIVDLKTDTENWQDAINDLHWEKFDSLISRLQSVSEEAENLIDILGNSDLVDEAGNWTDEGITSLGLYAQQMEAAEVEAKKYQDEIDYLNNNWQELGYTEDEYLERLGELKDGQYAAIQSYHDSKDAIVDMTKARVDAIKEGIEKEIEAYEELISKKKEELDAEKDLYDFQKGIANQQKNIAEIQRKLAALSGDNSAYARAKRAQLEAELAEAQQELSDTYYDRSVSNQQDALDKELDAFREEKDEEMESWDEYLENTNQVVADCLATVQENTETVYNTLQALGEEYGLSITESLTSPWAAGEDAIDSFTERFGDSMSATVDELRELEIGFIETMANIELAGKNAAQTVKDNFKEYKEAKKQSDGGNGSGNGDNNNGGSSNAGMVSSLSGNIQYGQSGDKVKKLQQALNDLGFNCGNVDGVFGSKTLAAVKKFQKSSKYGGAITADGIVGANTKKKFKTAGYASGTTGVKNNQWALIDELGEELVIRPSNGRMTFMEKGTGVVPADLTSNLMGWGELDPSIMLERNKPVISAAHVTNNTMEVNMEIAEVVHVDHVDSNNLPDLTKAVEKQLDKYMKQLNGQIRKYAR